LSHQLTHYLKAHVLAFLTYLETIYKHVTRPNTASLTNGTLYDLTRSRAELIAENAFLRQQLIILSRQTKQPSLTRADRGLLLLLASRVQNWKEVLLIVKPDTLLKWHRQGFRLFWRRKSKKPSRPSGISLEAIELIHAMARDNHLWGAKRIRDELGKLGHRVSTPTVRKYMKQVRGNSPPQRSSQTWANFLANHTHEIWACDFVQTYDLFFQTIFLFFIIELGSRRVVHFGITRSPTDAWVAQQLREATPFDEKPKYLIRDNDSKFGQLFTQAAAGIRILRTPI
jgi:putative transposase